MNIKQFLRSGLLIGLASITGMAQAVIVDHTMIGTWNLAPGSGNPTVAGGPDMATGQKFVIKVQYDTAVSVTRDVLTGSFTDSGQDMTVIELTGGNNTLDIFVPMEGFDSGSPFIYTQDQDTHFPAFIAEPTVNFLLGSDLSDTNNIIGLEYEGDFVTGSGFNIIEMFNTAAGAATPINQIGQVLNCGDASCAGSSIAITQQNSLTAAVGVVVTNDSVTFDSSMAAQTTGNDLGAGRSDGEDFLGSTWDVSGTTQPDGINIAVELVNAGLTSTIDTTTWNVTVDEQMTDLSGTGEVLVSYANTAPSSTLSATANPTGYDFAYTSDDVDLAINTIIAGFEQVVYSVFVDSIATSLFDDLIASGLLSLSNAELLAAFGVGSHLLEVIITDLAGATNTSSATFDVEDVISPIPVPPAFGLMLIALGFLGATGFRRRVGNVA